MDDSYKNQVFSSHSKQVLLEYYAKMDEVYDPNQYLPTIDAILSVAELEKITVKKIRNALQELFGIDLQPHKKDINEIILKRYYDLIEKRSQEETSEKERLKEIERQDAIMAARLSRTNERGPVVRPRKKQRAKPADGRTSNGGFNREMVLSTELQNTIGQEKCSRPQVVKLLWSYIKSNDLQNPNDKRQIRCDEKLQKLFKKKVVGAFEMNKILTKHIFKPEDVGGQAKLKKISSSDQDDSVDDVSDADDL